MAPGRVEPPSGIIKVAAPAIGIVSKVLVKVDDTVFAGEPLILLNDDEIQARYAAAEAQAGMRRRLRDEQAVTGKALERRRAEDAVAEQRPRCSMRRPQWTRPRRNGGRAAAPAAALTDARAALVRAQDELAKRQDAAPRHRRAAARRRTRRRPFRRAATWRSPASIWRS